MEFPDFQVVLNEYIIPWSSKLGLALFIFVIGRWIGKLLIKLVRNTMLRASMDDMLISFVASILNIVVLLVITVAALSNLGVNTSSLVALLGAAGLAVGLALQDSLKNFAAGVMLIIFRPFEDGDFIEAAGIAGTVLQVNVFNTILKTPDNRKIIVANGDVISSAITNYSANDTRRIDLTFGIGYDNDIEAAKSVMRTVVGQHPAVLKDPAIFIGVVELADSSVNITLRSWCVTSDYFTTSCELTEQVKLALDAADINMPYPQMDVHMSTELSQAA